MKIFTSKIAGLALTFLIGFNALGDVIYDSFVNTNAQFLTLTNGQQVGNEITLSSAKVSLNGFSFEYVTSPTIATNVGVDVKFYNGAPTGGSVFYDSGVFSPLSAAPPSPPPPGGADLNYTNSDLYSSVLPGSLNLPANFLLPTNFTFTLTFSGLSSGNILELLLANPPSGQIGSAPTNYWYNYTGGPGFALQSIPGYSADVGVEFFGTVKTPDVSGTAGLLGLGLVVMFVLRRKSSLAKNLKNV
jgi:hypothetical protein